MPRAVAPVTAAAARRWQRRGVAIALAIAAVGALLGLRAALHVSPWDRLHDDGDGRSSGSIYLPRGGRHVFACQCAAPVSIEIAGRMLPLRADARGPGPSKGLLTASIDLDAGVAPIVVHAPRGVRLMWHPPGRRGDPEYLPASSLSPEPPARARFSRPGTALLDGLVAVGLVAVATALALWWLWPALRRRWRRERRLVLAVAAVFALALAARLWDLGGAGQTFDEDVNWSAGRNYVENVVGLDGEPRAWLWNYEHPPVMKYLVGVGALFADGYGPARGVAALCVALGCALLVPIGARLWNLRAGLYAGGIAALTPHLIAHGKVVGHEAPTVLWWALALWLCLRAFDADVDADADGAAAAAAPAGPPSRRTLILRLVGIGVVLGLAICSRFVNLLLAPLIGVTLLLLAPRGWRLRTIGLGLSILPVVAVLTGLLIWPRLWSEPFVHLAEAWAKLSKPHAAEPFLGAMTSSPPRWYFLAYLYATAPLGLLLAVVAFGVRLARHRAWRAAAIAVALFAIPLGVALSPVRQDGVRYVMPSLLALALLAGAGLDELATRGARWRHAGAALAAAMALYLAVTCARVHPYYLDYYGEQVGGPAGVARGKRFELGWWGEGVDAAVAYVGQHAAPGARVYRDCVEALHLAWWRQDLWAHLAQRPADADWIVVQPAHRGCGVPADARLVHTVRAQGAPLVKVYRRGPVSP